ncbi:MAG: FkbM family methyltransferase [Verrucomicrobiota bacterium]|nr:FkbM family methyltransferase [Verrucomicrobiota bacterium]
MRLCFIFLLVFSSLKAIDYYEGTNTFRGYGKVDLNWMIQFLPYNPIIVEAGAYAGPQALYAAQLWPKSRRIIAFEPNPTAFNELTANTQTPIEVYPLALNNYNGSATLYLNHGLWGNHPSCEQESSLLAPSPEMEVYYKGPIIPVPCVVLDDWCRENQIDQIDILQLNLEGLELEVLQSSPNILKNTKIIVFTSFFHSYRINMANYFSVKDFLVKSNFVPLAHWYTAGARGMAVYISAELYDAYFVRCLGLGLGGLLYP